MQREQTMRKNSEGGGQREVLEKDMVKWKKNSNLQGINLRHRELKECSQAVFFRMIVSWKMLVALAKNNC